MSGIEDLKHGNFFRRFQYLYVTKLKKFALIRTIKEIACSPYGDLIWFCIFLIPLLICLILVAPFLYWRTMREQREYQIRYENRETGWHP